MPPCGHLLYPACGCPAPTPAPTPPAKTPTAVELARAALAANPTPPVLPNVRPPIRATHEVVGPRSVAVKLPPQAVAAQRAAGDAFMSGDIDKRFKEYKRRSMEMSFAQFFREAWKEVEPATDLVWNWHLHLICNVLQAVFEDWRKAKRDRKYQNLIRNLILNLPPGSSKSKILAVCFHAWMWMHAPGMKLIALSVNDDAAMRDARDARKLINSDWYRDTFNVKFNLKGDQDAISNFGNTLGGERLSMPSKSVVVGVRGDCVAGDVVVACEHGSMPIRDLVAVYDNSVDGSDIPRVWSVNQATGEMELKNVVAARRIENRPTIRVKADVYFIDCTPDHKIWDPNASAFVAAASLKSALIHGPIWPANLIEQIVVYPVRSIETLPDQDVFDIQVADNHNFFANGICTHNCLLIDDANDPSENDHERDIVNHIWDSTQSNRVNDMARSMRFGVQQRTNSNDWTGHVIARQGVWAPDNISGWLHVVLPAEYDPARKFMMPMHLVQVLRDVGLPDKEIGVHNGDNVIVFGDPRTVEGETIDKVRMPPTVLAAERRRWNGTTNFSGQMNQTPSDIEGARIKRNYWGWFRLEAGVRADVDDLPNGRPRPAGCHDGEAITIKAMPYAPGQWEFDWVIVSVDAAVKRTERGSNWGLGVIGGKDGRRYILDDRTQRGDILEIFEVLKDIVRIWHPDKVLIESAAGGPELKRRLLEEMSKGSLQVIELVEVKVTASEGKEARLDACLPVLANGMVYLREGAPWLEAWVDEMALFPNGQSDRVDLLTQALNHFASDEDAGHNWPSW